MKFSERLDNMFKEISKKNVIYISIISGIIIAGVIIALSLWGGGDAVKNPSVNELSVHSDAVVPGGNNKEVKHETTPEEAAGYYIENSDGWYYSFAYAPEGDFHGTFTSGFDASHESVADNPNKDFTAGGKWRLDHGEIKLYNDAEYQQSMWICGDYIVDSQNYFVGDVPESADGFQSSFICKAAQSGDTQVMNFYSDGKLIMEIVRNDGAADSGADAPELPSYQLIAGIYTIDGNMITSDINGVSQSFYIMDDGIAKWVYHKRK